MATSGIAEAQCKNGLSFSDLQHGFLSASDPSGALTIYRTGDGGRSWTGSRLPDPPGFVAGSAAQAVFVGPVRAFGATFLVEVIGEAVSGETRFVFRSQDGGATWAYLATTPVPSSVAFVTATRWLQLLLPGQTRETTDAGASWHLYASDYGQAAPVPPQVVFGDPQIGYATVRGSIRRTLDGGLHWTGIRTPGTS